jgi:hypothetical protein
MAKRVSENEISDASEFANEAKREEENFTEVEVENVNPEEMGQFVKFSIKGESISGVLEQRRQFRSQFGKEQTVYDIRTANDEGGTDLWTITGNRDLNRRLEKVRDGSFVRITWVDEVPIPNQPNFAPMKIFRVEVSRTPAAIDTKTKKSPFTLR